MAVGAHWAQIFDWIDQVSLCDSLQWLQMMHMYETSANLSIAILEIHFTNFALKAATVDARFSRF
jgi:hypothetical protein